MSRIPRGIPVLTTAAVAGLALTFAATGSAAAKTSQAAPVAPVAAGQPEFLTATLLGRNEIRNPNGEATGAPHGSATELLRIQGSTVSYAIRWQGIGAPTEAHVHAGKAGTDGPVRIQLFGAALPTTVQAVTGTVTVTDTALLTALRTNPASFYANLHTAAFPGGAVRGQFRQVKSADLVSVLHTGPLAALVDGGQEVPAAGATSAGSQNGHAVAFVDPQRGSLRYALTWSGLGSPTEGHVHQGVAGSNGPVAVPLFAAPGGLPASVTGVAGTVTGLDAKVTGQISAHPGRFYVNLHTAAFPTGAARGQLFPVRGNG